MSKIVLDKIMIGLRCELSKTMLDAFVEKEYDIFTDSVMAEIRGYVLGENQDDICIKYPANWWQAFKDRWFFKWMLKYCPIKYTIHNITSKILYPDMKISLPEKKHSLVFEHSNGIE